MASAASISIQRVKQAELARLLGVSRQSINELVTRGVIPSDKDGLIDVEMARAALLNRMRPSSPTATAAASAAPPPKTAPATSQDAANEGGATSYHVAKTLREAAEARMAQLKLAEMQGNMISRELASKAAYEIGRQVRDALQVSRRRLSPYLAASTSVTECEEILRKEHQELLANLVTAMSKVVAVEALQA